MAVRRWRVRPDHEQLIGDEVVGVVSFDALARAVMDGITIGDRMGGVLTVVWGRHKTDLEGEAVTTGAVIEWKDVPRAKLKPEVDVDVLGQQAPLAPPEPEQEPTPAPVLEVPAEPAEALADYDAAEDMEEEEDTSSMVLHRP